MSERQILPGTITLADGTVEEVSVAVEMTSTGLHFCGADGPITLPPKATLSVELPAVVQQP